MFYIILWCCSIAIRYDLRVHYYVVMFCCVHSSVVFGKSCCVLFYVFAFDVIRLYPGMFIHILITSIAWCYYVTLFAWYCVLVFYCIIVFSIIVCSTILFYSMLFHSTLPLSVRFDYALLSCVLFHGSVQCILLYSVVL